MKPKLSIMIPTFNSVEYLKDAIDSVLHQDFQDMEILISDNASTDTTEVFVKSYSDTRIRYHKNEVNIGTANNLNELLKHANGTYLRYLCADDVLLPGILKKQVEALDSYSNVGLVTCDMIITDENLENGKRVNFYPGFEKGATVAKACGYAFSNYIGGPSNIMFRRDASLNIIYDNKLAWVSDLTFFLDILDRCDYLNIDEPGIYYRRHAKTDTSKAEKNGRQRIEEIDISFARHGFYLAMLKFIFKDIGISRKAKLLLSLLNPKNRKSIFKLPALVWSLRNYRIVLLSDFFQADIATNCSFSNTGGIISIGKGTSVGSFTEVCIKNAPGAELETSCLLIGENCNIGEHNNIRAEGGIIRIGSNVKTSKMVTIVASDSTLEQKDISIDRRQRKRNRVVIEDDVCIGTGVTIMPGAYISKGSNIAANTVVTRFVSDNSLEGAPPAIQKRNHFAHV